MLLSSAPRDIGRSYCFPGMALILVPAFEMQSHVPTGALVLACRRKGVGSLLRAFHPPLQIQRRPACQERTVRPDRRRAGAARPVGQSRSPAKPRSRVPRLHSPAAPGNECRYRQPRFPPQGEPTGTGSNHPVTLGPCAGLLAGRGPGSGGGCRGGRAVSAGPWSDRPHRRQNRRLEFPAVLCVPTWPAPCMRLRRHPGPPIP